MARFYFLFVALALASHTTPLEYRSASPSGKGPPRKWCLRLKLWYTPSPTSAPATQPTPTSTPSVAPSSSGPSGGSVSDVDTVTAHNAFRAIHGAQALTWSSERSTTALTWASKCNFWHSHGQYDGTYLLFGGGFLKTHVQRILLLVPVTIRFHPPLPSDG
jgi:uncharacterized protein YkwD